MTILYEVLDPVDSKRILAEFKTFGPAKVAALSFIAMHENINTGILDLDSIILAHRYNKTRPDHHPMTDHFTEEDIKFTWDFLEKNKVIKPLPEIRLEAD